MNYLNFAYPLALLGVPLILGYLVWIYRRRGRGTRRVVPTLLLLRQLSQPVSARRRFTPPLRFFFELLLLVGLIAAIAGVSAKNVGQKVILLVDNSLSMAQRVGVAGEQTIERARGAAADKLAALGPTTRVGIYETSPRLRRLHEGWLSPFEARPLLREVTPAYSADRLQAALTRLVGAEDQAQTLVFTDRPVAGPPRDRIAVFNVLSDSERSAQSNLALLGLRLDQGAVVATVQNFGAAPVEALLSVSELRETLGESGSTELQQLNFRIDSRSTATPKVQLETTGTHLYRVTISSITPQVNVLTEDDQGWISTSAPTDEIAVVSDLSPRELGLDRIRIYRFTQIRPSEFAEKIRERQFGGYIFHRTGVAQPPAGPTIFIYPLAVPEFFSVSEPQSGAAIVRWEHRHPVLSYLTQPGIRIGRSVPIIAGPWAEEIIGTSAGSALVVGEQLGSRIAVSGMELFPFESRENPSLSVLTLNLLKWSFGGGHTTGYQPVYAALPEDSAKWRYIDPGSGTELTIIADRPGVIQSIDGSESKYLAVNFFDSEESNIAGATEIALPATAPPTTNADQESRLPLTGLLVQLLCVLLVVDMLFQLIRVRRRSTAEEAR